MTRIMVLLLGAMATVIFALVVLVILPKAMLTKLEIPAEVKPYNQIEARGREIYIQNGCVYCHTQQVRDTSITTDVAKGLGSRPSVPADYWHDKPHLLGTMRTGPDLFNVGNRLPDAEWHLLHLYQPRALVPWSIMPALPFLFEHKPKAEKGDRVLKLPAEYAPADGVIVSKPDAEALVAYLLSLKHEYPIPSAKPEGGEGADAPAPNPDSKAAQDTGEKP
jgi:cytochrome c oxidase cbb3-type subunit 2